MTHAQTDITVTQNARLFKALEALVIHSPTQYTFCGTPVSVPQQTPTADGTLPGANLPPHLAMIGALQAQLYGSVYNHHFDNQPAAPPATMTDMTEELSRANPGRERWDHGWQIYQASPNGMVQAHKDGRAHMFYPGQYMPLTGTAQGVAQPGTFVNVYLAKEMRYFQQGFYIALSEHPQLYYEQVSIVRVYWNIGPDAAPVLVRELVKRFNRFQIPLRFKCLSYRELYDRYDAGVLFVGRRRWSVTALILEELYPSLKPYLRPETPLFTKSLAPGVALAEDPATGESFGTARCRLVAEGIWNAFAQGQQTERARRDAIAAVFSREGITLDRPWLNAGSVDIYDAKLG